MVQQLYANSISMLTIQSVFCVYTSFSKYVLGWFSPVLFIVTHGEQMYTIGPNASQTHVLFCDFFKQLILWKSFRNITENMRNNKIQAHTRALLYFIDTIS